MAEDFGRDLHQMQKMGSGYMVIGTLPCQGITPAAIAQKAVLKPENK